MTKSWNKEVYEFNNDDFIVKIGPSIERILDFKSHTHEGARPELRTLFVTPAGRSFGEQADNILDFVMRWTIISILLPVMTRTSSIVTEGIARGDLEDFLNVDSQPIEEQEKIRALKMLLSGFDSGNLEEVEEILISDEDAQWYLSLITFALHSYLDVYSISLIERLSSRKNVFVEIRSEARKANNELDWNSLKRRSPVGRLIKIEELLEIEQLLEPLIESEGLDIFRKGCKQFGRVRNKLAHANPKLKEDQYSFGNLQIDLSELEVDFSEIIEKTNVPKYVEEMMTEMVPAMKTMSEIFKKATLITLLAIMYPAILDVAIDGILALN